MPTLPQAVTRRTTSGDSSLPLRAVSPVLFGIALARRQYLPQLLEQPLVRGIVVVMTDKRDQDPVHRVEVAIARTERSPSIRKLGFVSRIAVYVALFAALYKTSPALKWDDLETASFNDIVVFVVYVAIGIGLLKWLFEPSKDDSMLALWGWAGVALIAGGLSFASYWILR